MVDPDQIAGVRIEGAARCRCGHHPFDHHLAHALLTGEPAPCSFTGCQCKALELAEDSPAPLELLDGDGRPV